MNRYKTDYGKVDAETILELDKEALTAKDEYMTTKAGRGNVASMKIGDDIYILLQAKFQKYLTLII